MIHFKNSSTQSFKVGEVSVSNLHAVLDNLPALLKQTLEPLEDVDERRIGIYSALVMAGSLMPQVSIHYHQKRNYPSLFLLIIMPPASGKGILNPLSRILKKVNDELMEKYNEGQLAYKKEEAIYQKSSKKGIPMKPPVKPKLPILRIAGNITSASLITQLEENNGNEFVIVVETEMDSFGKSTHKGKFSELNSTILRNAYEFENISQMRKTNNEKLNVDVPKVSLILSGTSSQVKNILHSNADGLLSRFMLVSGAIKVQWRDVKPNEKSIPLEDHYNKLAVEYYKLWKFQHQRKIDVQLTDEQWQILNSYGGNHLNILNEDGELHDENAFSLIKRHANMIARIICILTVMRAMQEDNRNDKLICRNEDFAIAQFLANESYSQSLELFQSLSSDSSGNGKLQKLHAVLPPLFTSEQLKEIWKPFGVKDRTMYRDLKALKKCGLIISLKKGVYQKV